MRTASPFALLTVCFISALLPGAAWTRADEPASNTAERRQFSVECRIVDSTSGKIKAVACPKVTVFEHQPARCTDQTQRPFVVAVSDAGKGAYEPVIEVLTEGRTIDFVCHRSGPNHITLDLTIEESQIVGVDVKEIEEGLSIQEPRLQIEKIRRFVTCASGGSFSVPLDGLAAAQSKRRAEFIVTALPSE